MISALPESGAWQPNTLGAHCERPRISFISAELQLAVALAAEVGPEVARPQVARLHLLLQRAHHLLVHGMRLVVDEVRAEREVERLDLAPSRTRRSSRASPGTRARSRSPTPSVALLLSHAAPSRSHVDLAAHRACRPSVGVSVSLAPDQLLLLGRRQQVGVDAACAYAPRRPRARRTRPRPTRARRRGRARPSTRPRSPSPSCASTDRTVGPAASSSACTRSCSGGATGPGSRRVDAVDVLGHVHARRRSPARTSPGRARSTSAIVAIECVM